MDWQPWMIGVGVLILYALGKRKTKASFRIQALRFEFYFERDHNWTRVGFRRRNEV
jgi:hypothetical protein